MNLAKRTAADRPIFFAIAEKMPFDRARVTPPIPPKYPLP